MEGLLDEAALPRALELFCSAESSEEERSQSINTVLLQLHQGKVQGLNGLLTGYLKPYLVSGEAWVRMRGTLLVALMLERLPDLAIDSKACGALVQFLIDRYQGDADSGVPCCNALQALMEFHEDVFPKDKVSDVVQVILASHYVPSLTQSLRAAVWTLMKCITERFREKMSTSGDVSLVIAFADAMDGEKDPRCLLVALDVGAKLLSSSEFDGHDAEAVERMFDITSVYFPIVFRPPSNDPFHIRSEDLWETLHAVFTSHPDMGVHVVPMVMDKLNLTSPEVAMAKVDSLKTLQVCIPYYDLASWAVPLRDILLRTCLNADVTQVAEEAGNAIQTIVALVSKQESALQVIHAVSSLSNTCSDLWRSFVSSLVESCVVSVGQSIDSMQGRASGRVLCSIAKSSPMALGFVMEKLTPTLKQWCTSSDVSSSQRCAAFELLHKLTRTIDSDIDFEAGRHPILPSVACDLFILLDTAIEETMEWTRSEDGSPSKKQRTGSIVAGEEVTLEAAVLALKELIIRPPTPILSRDQVSSTITRWSTLSLSSSETVRRHCLKALVQTGKSRADYGGLILALALPVIQNSGDMRALAQLCEIPQVFSQVVPHLSTDYVAIIDGIINSNADYLDGMERCVVPLEASSNRVLVPELLHRLSNKEDGIGAYAVSIVEKISRSIRISVQKKLLDYVNSHMLHADESVMEYTFPVIVAIIVSMRPQVILEFSGLEQLVRQMFSISISASSMSDAASLCVASLLNKMDIRNPLIEELVSSLIVEREDIKHLSSLLWVAKGLAMRNGFTGTTDISKHIEECLHSSSNAEVKKKAASYFGFALRPSQLNKDNHCNEGLFFRQKFFTQSFQLLKTKLEIEESPVTKSLLLLALVQLMQNVPQGILMQEIQVVVLLLIQALSNPDMDIRIGALATLTSTIKGHPELFEPHLNTLVPVALQLAQFTSCTDSKVRRNAINCLIVFADYPYNKVHTLRPMITKELGNTLDDPKRAIRKRAVECRNKWMILQNV